MIFSIKNIQDDQFAAETQENDGSTEERHSSDVGLPRFAQPDNLPPFIPRPSGNMVKMRCQGEGKEQRNIFQKQINAHRIGSINYTNFCFTQVTQCQTLHGQKMTRKL